MTESDVMKLLSRLEVIYDEAHDPERAKRWRVALADADAGAITAAADAYIADEPRWFPKPAQLLALVPPPKPQSRPRTERPEREPTPIRGGTILPDSGGYWFWPDDRPIPKSVLADVAQYRRQSA